MRQLLVASILLIAAGVAASLAAEPVLPDRSIRERIRDASFWHRMARHGDQAYLMTVSPSRSDVQEAQERDVPVTAVDGAAIALGRPIEFRRPGDLECITALGPDVRRAAVVNGALSFEVGGPNAYLMWGNFDGQHPKAGYLPFGTAYEWRRAGGWYRNTFLSNSGPTGIYLRVRQSAQESTWKIATGPNPDFNEVMPKSPPAVGGYTAAFKVLGTDWQTVAVIYGDKVRDRDGRPAVLRPFGSFVVYPGDPGNKVEIAWIRITEPRVHSFARRTFELPDIPRDGAITLSTWDADVFVNGKLAADARFSGTGVMGPRLVKLVPFLKQGRNVIAVHSLSGYGELSVTGGVTCANGTYVPLHSWLPLKPAGQTWERDESVRHFCLESPFAGTWKTAYLSFRPDDWVRFMEPNYDDSDWGELRGLTTTGHGPGTEPYSGLLRIDLPPPERAAGRGEEQSGANSEEQRPARSHPIYSVREPVRFIVQALHVSRERPRYTLRFTLTDQDARKPLEEGVLPLDANNRGQFFRDGLPVGPYEVHWRLYLGDRLMDERRYEFLVVGPIPQPEVSDDNVLAGMTLKPVVDIDCTAEPPAGQLGAFRGHAGGGKPYTTAIVAAPFGKFRETGDGNGDCFSYKVSITNPRRPHLLEVIYPDDRHRIHTFFYTEVSPNHDAGYPPIGVNRCSVSAISGWPRQTNRFRTARGIFWPVGRDGTVDVYTTRYNPKDPPAPAAAARIRVYEIDGELPRLHVHDFPGQFKPIGPHTERGAYVPWPTYYAGRNDPITVCFNTIRERPDFYADWYSTASNLVRHLRFHGLNFYIAGQHMYGGTNFPSVFNDNDNGTGGATIQCQHDWGGILGAIFSENECGYVSSFEYINNSIIVGQGMPTGRQLAAGMPTLLAVSHHGKAIDTGFGIYHPTPLPSYVHPKVQEMLLTEVDELIALNREYPAWKGINFLLHSLCGPSFGEVGGDPLKCGYEDAAVERFEKDTGIRIPVDAKDPERFRKRYDWLQAHPNELDAWVQWRCDVLLELNRKIRDRIRAARPDCNLYLNIAYPYGRREELLQKAAVPESLRKYIMLRGWDVRAYQREEGMVLYTMAAADAEKRFLMHGKNDEMPLERARALHPNYLAMFANDGRGGVDLHTIFTENWPYAAPGEWVWSTNGAWNGYHWPAGDDFCDLWTNTLIRTNPTLVAFNWHDSNMDSRLEPGLRRFTRAWRPLPNGHYDVLRGNGRDKNLVLQRCREHPDYHYAANPWSWEATIELTFSAGARVTDLHTNRQQPLDLQRVWRFKLPPYGVQSFRVEAGGTVESAAVIIADDAIEQLREQVRREESLAQRRHGESGGAAAARFSGLVANLRQAFDRSDYGVVEDTLRGGYEYHLARIEMEKQHKDEK